MCSRIEAVFVQFRNWLRARLRRFFRRPTVQQRRGSLFRRYHPDQVGPYTREMTPEELRELPARWREKREPWVVRRARQRGYDLSDFAKW